jgi:hypothetical protein
MRPSSQELLRSVADALERQVMPTVSDKWAASTLRSAMQLLRHVALRVEHEPALLRQQEIELTAVLSRTNADLAVLTQDASLVSLRSDLAAALAVPADPRDDAGPLERRVDALLAAAESVVAARDAIRGAAGTLDIHDRLIDCLSRQLARELPMVEPFQSTPPI